MELISPLELQAWLSDRTRPAPQLIDVREPEEFAAGRIEGARLIPLRTLPLRLHELDPAAATVMICRSGARSHHAGLFLKQNGFARVYNLAGGLLAWSRDVAPAAA